MSETDKRSVSNFWDGLFLSQNKNFVSGYLRRIIDHLKYETELSVLESAPIQRRNIPSQFRDEIRDGLYVSDLGRNLGRLIPSLIRDELISSIIPSLIRED